MKDLRHYLNKGRTGIARRMEKWSYLLLPEIGPFRAMLRRRRRAAFERMFAHNGWLNTESISGPGSTLAATELLREELPKLAQQLGVKVFFDAPCGDYNWFSQVQLSPEVVYLGGDIVAALVEANQRRFGSPTRSFRTFDIVNDPLPKADLWLCRDCLFHFPFKDIHRVLRKFAASDIPYLLTTLNPDHQPNTDIAPGDFRFLNLCAPPFNLPKPILTIEEHPKEGTMQCLGLWDKRTISNVFLNR